MKFWNKTDNEIYIYGDIVTEKWSSADVTASDFLNELKNFGDNEVDVHINSSGGDVFTALAISNVIKSHGNVNIIIDGICASAATLIAASGKSVKMASNALFMTHSPTVFLTGFFNSHDLYQAVNSLDTVSDVILQTYKQRPLSEAVNLETWLMSEEWMTASAAKEKGFVDEIIGASELEFDNKRRYLIVNKVAIDCSRVNADKFSKIKPLEETNMQAEIDAAVKLERKRIGDLTAMKADNPAVNALLDLAISNGQTVEEITPYIDAVKSNTADNLAQITSVIRDQMQSGAAGVVSSPAEDAKAQAADRLVNFANAMI